MENKIITSNAFMVITDYNVLPLDLEKSWIPEYTDNYLIYDKAHRFEESNKIKHQPNVGVNIYDMFDFISNNYGDLPEIIIFCKSCVIPRHCGVEKFKTIINNTKFTSIENYVRDIHLYIPGYSTHYIDLKDEYSEVSTEVEGVVANLFRPKYIFTYKDLLNSIFKNAKFDSYIRFAPGANYIIPRENILKYNKNFYETMRHYVSWSKQPGEAYLLERALYTIFNNDLDIKEEFCN